MSDILTNFILNRKIEMSMGECKLFAQASICKPKYCKEDKKIVY